MKPFISRRIRLCILMLCLMLLGCGCTPVPSPEQNPPQEPQPPQQDPETPGEQPSAPKAPKYTGYDTPCIVETLYTEQNIVADMVVTDKRFQADPTGQEDATKAINAAIAAVYAKGGGTVYLPAGQYKVTETIKVLPFVSLVGDYNAKAATDGSGEYGTVILAYPESVDADFPALFEIGGSAGVCGLTVYYPEQDINDVKPYGYTVYGERPRMVMLRDLTFINSYQGIGACLGGESNTHELLQVENVRMTVLSMGYRATLSREIG